MHVILPASTERRGVGEVGGIKENTTRTRDGNGPNTQRVFDPLGDGDGTESLYGDLNGQKFISNGYSGY